MRENTIEKIEKGLMLKMSSGTLKEMLLRAKKAFTSTTEIREKSNTTEIQNLTSWKESPQNLAKKTPINEGFELRAIKGIQNPLFNIKVHCPVCEDSVVINRLFEDCVFCGFHFDIDWKNPLTKGMKTDNIIVAGEKGI